jgi:hypothetical protein
MFNFSSFVKLLKYLEYEKEKEREGGKKERKRERERERERESSFFDLGSFSFFVKLAKTEKK